MRNYYGFAPYVPVAERRRNAQKRMAQLVIKGKTVQPVHIEGRTIARSFWGKAWCDNLESYSDFENRLPRGRTYLRNGSVVHLEVREGEIEAKVSGSELYTVNISITPVAREKWKTLCQECAGGIGSLVELLQGRFSDRVMGVITRKSTGLFPSPSEIELKCSCPDWATMCKHVAAVLYGVGARLDEHPELLFVLRSVNQEELITQAASMADLTAKTQIGASEISESEIGSLFGIEMDTQNAAPANNEDSVKSTKPVIKKTGGKKKAPLKTRKKGVDSTTSAPKPSAKLKKVRTVKAQPKSRKKARKSH